MPTGKDKKKTLCIIGANLKGAVLFYLATRYGNFDEVTLIDKKSSDDIFANKQYIPLFTDDTPFTQLKTTILKESLTMMANYASYYDLDCFLENESLLLADTTIGVLELQKKYQALTTLSELAWWDSKALFKYEPDILKGRYITKDSIAAIYASNPMAFININIIGNHLINSALKYSNRAKVMFSFEVLSIQNDNNRVILEGYAETLNTTSCVITGKENALYFAKLFNLALPLYYQRIWQQGIEIKKLTHRNILMLDNVSLSNDALIKFTPNKPLYNTVQTGYSLKDLNSPSPPLISSLLNKHSAFRNIFPQVRSLEEKEALLNHTFFNISSIGKFFSRKRISKIYPLADINNIYIQQISCEKMLLMNRDLKKYILDDLNFTALNKIDIGLSTQQDDYLAFQTAIDLLDKISKREALPINYEAIYRDLG